MQRNIRKQIYKIQDIPFIGKFLTEIIVYLHEIMYKYNILSVKPDKNIEHVISEKYKFIYIAIPKVATRSFIDFFLNAEYDFNCYIKEENISKLKKDKKYSNFFCFSFVRDPVSRIISCYFDKILYPSKINEARVINKYKGIYKGMNFEEFIDWLLTPEGRDDIADRHWMSQHLFLNNHCDFIGKIENFDIDAAIIQNKINTPPIILSNKNPSKSNKALCISESTKEKIYKRYRQDFDILGYRIY